MKRANLFSLAFALQALSCGPPLPAVWKLSEFRVVGVELSNPEPARGERTTMTLHSADPRGRLVRVAWLVSAFPLRPATSVSSTDGGTGLRIPVCDSPGDPLPVCPTGFQCGCGPTMDVTVPPGGGLPSASGSETLSVLGFACAGGELTVGTDLSNPFRCGGTQTLGWTFTRTINVRSQMPGAPPNENPVFSQVLFGPKGGTLVALESAGAPVVVDRCSSTDETANPCPQFTFEVTFSEGSRQRFRDFDVNTRMVQERSERLTVGYLVTEGTLAGGFRTDSSAEPTSRMGNDWSAGATPGPVRVILYASDGRGGFALTERTITIR